MDAPTIQHTYDDGVSVQEIIPPHSTVHVQFWSGRSTSEDFTVHDFEKYVNSVHDDVMINGVCGFDQWVDNHIAVDGHGSPTLSGLCGFFMRQLFVVWYTKFVKLIYGGALFLYYFRIGY